MTKVEYYNALAQNLQQQIDLLNMQLANIDKQLLLLKGEQIKQQGFTD